MWNLIPLTMSAGHEHDHHGHDHSGDHHKDMLVLTARKPKKLKAIDADTLIHVKSIEEGSFAIASSKKQLNALMRSDVDVVYDDQKGKLYHNANGEAKGWGKRRFGGLIARIKSKSTLIVDQFEGLSAFDLDGVTGVGQHGHGDHNHDTEDQDVELQTMFSSRSAATAAAKNFSCKGAHQHGDMWMPCNNMADMVMPTLGSASDSHSEHDHSNHNHSGNGDESHQIV